MKSIIQFKAITPPLVIITVALLCLAATGSRVQAVTPPPDGGYPGGNTAEGQNALLSRTTGGFNAAIGWLSLRGLTTGSFNTGVGAGTLALNNADQNTATGAGALLSNTIGSFNTAHGAFALFTNTEGGGNTATGLQSLFHNTIGNANTATGEAALFNNSSGNDNTANGDSTLVNNVTGEGNVAIGSQALHSNTAGSANTAVGGGALFSSTGTGNIAIGFNAGNNVSTASSVICIGLPGQDVSNSCYIGNIFNVTSSGGTAVFINSDGKLGTTTSSKRFKKEIKPMDKASEAIFALKPVSFRYTKDVDRAGTSQLGLVAEDVEKVSPDLVVRDKNGEIYSVRYEAVNAMLLNEFLKEHRKNEEQQATIAQLKKEMETVVARLKEQDSEIQRVSAQIEVSKAVGQTALNNP